jgi:hypothetical protein
MTEYYETHDAIDGRKVFLRIKKLVPSTPVKSPTGFLGIKYKCSLDCYAEIKLKHAEEELKIITSNSRHIAVNVGDCLKCNRLFFIHEGLKRINNFKVTMMSGRHECSECTSKNRIYAEIEQPFDQIVHAIEKRLALENDRKQIGKE